jgi:hypothetical protein
MQVTPDSLRPKQINCALEKTSEKSLRCLGKEIRNFTRHLRDFLQIADFLFTNR